MHFFRSKFTLAIASLAQLAAATPTAELEGRESIARAPAVYVPRPGNCTQIQRPEKPALAVDLGGRGEFSVADVIIEVLAALGVKSPVKGKEVHVRAEPYNRYIDWYFSKNLEGPTWQTMVVESSENRQVIACFQPLAEYCVVLRPESLCQMPVPAGDFRPIFKQFSYYAV